MSDSVTKHIADRAKIPAALQGIDWQEMHNQGWYDGDALLVAVPMRDSSGDWSYELSVITICCDEDYFRIECDGEPWSNDGVPLWETVDFYVQL